MCNGLMNYMLASADFSIPGLRARATVLAQRIEDMQT
jgi:hypothetical protein